MPHDCFSGGDWAQPMLQVVGVGGDRAAADE